MIEIDEVSKTYGERRVVDRLSLTIPDGAFCVVLGPSGCGKSTTLRMINRLVAPDSGTIRVAGEDVSRGPPEALRRRIGYVIQSTGLFPHWRVEDNIATVPRLLGWPAARVHDRVSELLQLLRLDPGTYRRKYPHQLSGGEQQRVGIARAIVTDPTLLLCDEPTGDLDRKSGDEILNLLQALNREHGKTILMVTHDPHASARASRTVHLDKGQLGNEPVK